MASQFLQRIERNNPRQRDGFGSTIKFSRDGSVMAIASPGTSETTNPIVGAISIYNLSSGKWVFIEDIVLPNYVVALDHAALYLEMNQDGTILVIPIQDYDATPLMNGGVLIYVLSGSTYVFRNLLRISPRIKPPSGNVLNIFGFQVAMSHDGNTLAVSAPWDVNTAQASVGGVYVLETTDNWSTWTYKELFHDENGTQLGLNIAISGDGNNIFAGRDDPSNFGSVLFFQKPGSAWWDYTDGVLPKVLVASDQALGDYFGFAKHTFQYLHTAGSAIASNYDGSKVFIGSPFKETDLGHVHIFEFSPISATYDEVQIIIPPSGDIGMFFGWSLSVDDLSNVLVIGAQAEDVDGIVDVGVNHFFELNTANGNYEETEKISSPTPVTLSYGAFRVEVSNNTKYLAAGSIDEAASGLQFAGVVNVWQLQRTPPVRPQRYRALVTVEEANLSATSAQLDNINSDVNQYYKWTKKKVVNTDTGGTVIAQGPAPSDPWEFDTGGIAHAPGGSVTYSQLVIAASPTAYYEQNEKEGIVGIDTMGFLNGEYRGTPEPTLNSTPLKAGDPKSSVFYITTAGHMYIDPLLDNPLNSAGNMAVEVIYQSNTTALNRKTLVYKGTGSTSEFSIISFWPDASNDQILIENDNGAQVLSPLFTPNQIRYLVVNMAADGNVDVYLDGALLYSLTMNRLGSISPIAIGSNLQFGDIARSDISDTAFYNRLLTQSEITERSNKALLG